MAGFSSYRSSFNSCRSVGCNAWNCSREGWPCT